MTSSQQTQSRFLPTLTEIVQPDELTRKPMAFLPTPEEKVQSALRQLDRAIEQRVREELDALVHTLVLDQVEALKQRLHEEFQTLVRHAATQAMTDLKNQP